MKNELLKFVLIVLGSIGYTILFSGQGAGLNLLLFSVLAVGLAWWQLPELRLQRLPKLLGVATVLTGLLYVWQHSALAYLTHLLIFLLFIGFTQAQVIRFVVFGGILGLVSLLEVPALWSRHFRQAVSEHLDLKGMTRWVPTFFCHAHWYLRLGACITWPIRTSRNQSPGCGPTGLGPTGRLLELPFEDCLFLPLC